MTIREWYACQSVNPAVQEQFDKLFALADKWNRWANIPTDVEDWPKRDQQCQVAQCAHELKEILNGRPK